MKRFLLVPALCLAWVELASARGLLIPVEPDLPPLAMLNHHVYVTCEDQVAITKVDQTFRNHTDRQLEATYVFPVPEGASVRDFAMWVNGKRMKGELLQADRAKQIYTSFVQQTKNPALLDYIGSDMLSLTVYPIAPRGDQKVEVSFTAVAKKEHDVVQYQYPLTTDLNAVRTLEEFRLQLHLKSQQPIGSIYSPTHDVTVQRSSDHEASIYFEQQSAQLNQDFQLFYTSSGEDIGLTALEHRPVSDERGYVMFLVTPRAELSQQQKVPRDIVFAIDTSGSMIHDNKMDQAKKALQYCLRGLTADDRFALISFATTVNRYRDRLVPATEQQVQGGTDWVADQYAGGGTAIHDALTSALDLRGGDQHRMFTVVFFTDGQPTIGETDTNKILADLGRQNSANTRIFSFGLGDDLNAVFLDQLAEQTRAVSSYVRPEQDIEVEVAGFFDKIHHPVLANLRLSTRGKVRLAEVYPPSLPDLFHGDQLVVLARVDGAGRAKVVLEGHVGVHQKRFVHDVDFQKRATDKPFVEELWARRKVGYLLDQIRTNGEQQELVDEVVRLAKGYGITTPYTSYLIMPDVSVALASVKPEDTPARWGRTITPAALVPPAADADQPNRGSHTGAGRPVGAQSAKRQKKLAEFAREVQEKQGDLADNRGRFQERVFQQIAGQPNETSASAPTPASQTARQRIIAAQQLKSSLDQAYANYQSGQFQRNQVRKLGVDLSVCTNTLKCQRQIRPTAVRRVANRNCMEIGGVWIDEGFSAQTPTVAVKAQSDAYFRILERQPQMTDVFRLGNYLVWIAPSGTALVIDTTDGKDAISDREIEMLFARN